MISSRNRMILAAVAAALALAAAPASAGRSCQQTAVGGGNRAVEPQRFNQALFDAALTAQINYLRCRKGLQQLFTMARLRKEAEGHARWMARSRSLSHTSNRPGKRTPKDRVLSTGMKVRVGSENIAKVSLYRIDEVGRFRINDARTCRFSTYGGAPISRHSYNTLARHVAELWYKSSGHRKNLMEPKARVAGSAAGFDPKSQHCGQFFVVQTFAG